MRLPSQVACAVVFAAACAGSTSPGPQAEEPVDPKATATVAPSGAIVPAGTTMSVRLLDRLAGKRLSVGRSFRAELAQPLVGPGGAVLLPQGTELEGHVRAVRVPGPGVAGSVELVVDRARHRGETLSLHTATIEAPLTTPERGVPEENVVLGVILGAVIGTFVDPWEGTYRGGAVGAAGGAVGSLGRVPADAFVAEGTLVTTWLEEPLRLPGLRGRAARLGWIG